MKGRPPEGGGPCRTRFHSIITPACSSPDECAGLAGYHLKTAFTDPHELSMVFSHCPPKILKPDG